MGEDWRDPAVRAAAFGLAIDEHLDDWSAMAGAMLSDAELAFGSVVGAVTAAWERSIDLAGPADIAPDVERRLVAEARWRLQDRRPIVGVHPPTPTTAAGLPPDEDAPDAPDAKPDADDAHDVPPVDRYVVDRVARVLATAGAERAIVLGLLGLGRDEATVVEHMGIGRAAVQSLVRGGEEAIDWSVGAAAVEAAGGAIALAALAVDRWRLPASDPLREAVRRIPGAVPPLRSLGRRRAAGVAPWLAAMAVAVALTLLPSAVDIVRAMVEPAPALDPLQPVRGVVRVPQIPSAPWVPLIALPGAWLVVRRLVRRSGGLDPVRTLPRWDLSGARVVPAAIGAWVGLLLLVSPAGGTLLGDDDAVAAMTVAAPGPLRPEAGGPWAAFESDGLASREGSELPNDVVPSWIFRRQPREPFWYTVRVRNLGLLPITVLGLSHGTDVGLEARLDEADAVATSLALPRDPSTPAVTAADLVPYRPVLLAPGQEVDVVLVFVAGGCAAPDGVLPATSGSDADGGTWQMGAAGYGVAFDVLGWQVDGEIWPPIQALVPTTPGCLPDIP